MSYKRVIDVHVFVQHQYDGGRFDFGSSYRDGSLNDVINSLIAIRDSIPEEFREAARCAIGSVSGYEGSHYASVTISYPRPETDEEFAARKRSEQAHAKAHEQKLRQEYEKLKARFG